MSFETMSMGINAVSSMLSSYMGSRVAANTYNSNASSMFRQSSLYDAQGAMMMRSANAYSGAAKQFVKAGKANAKQDRLRAGEVQQFTDANIQESVKEARQKVGRGLVAFASNGVLLEGREGTAAGMWEQDEAAENSYQQLLIQQNGENQIWELLTSANMKAAGSPVSFRVASVTIPSVPSAPVKRRQRSYPEEHLRERLPARITCPSERTAVRRIT